MIAALPLPADTAGTPGFCCLCGRRAPTQLCKRCFAIHADADGQLPPWVAEVRREASRLAVREYRARREGVSVVSYEASCALVAARLPLPGTADLPRRLHRRGVAAPPLAPQVTEFLDAAVAADMRVGDPLARLRRYSDSGVPLDMPGFLRLLHALFGWPPPGTTVDARHKEALVDLYELVYPA